MSSAALRGRRTSVGSAPAMLPNMQDIDGLPGVLDTNDDLMNHLVAEAGAADADAILETGLPEDYDPSGGAGLDGFDGGFASEPSGAVGKVLRLGGSAAKASAPIESGGRTRKLSGKDNLVGSKVPVAVASKFAAAPAVAQAPPEQPLDELDDEDPDDGDGGSDALDQAVVEPEEAAVATVTDELPPEDDEEPETAVLPAPSPEAVADIMAELASGDRITATAAREETPVPEPTQVTAVEPPVREAQPGSRHVPRVAIAAPLVGPGWAKRFSVEDEAWGGLTRLLPAGPTEYFATPVFGGTLRFRLLFPTMERLVAPRRLSTASEVGYREADGTRVVFRVARHLYDTHLGLGMLLLEDAKGDRLDPLYTLRAITVCDPLLMLHLVGG